MIRVIHSCGSASSALASRPRNARTNQRQTPAHRHVSVTGFLLTGRGGRPGRTASGHFTRGTAQVTIIEKYPRRPLLPPDTAAPCDQAADSVGRPVLSAGAVTFPV